MEYFEIEIDEQDSIEVYIDNIVSNKGKITITCCGHAWTATWSGCRCNVERFFLRNTANYLIKSLVPDDRRRVTDVAASIEAIKEMVTTASKNKLIDKDYAQDALDGLARIDTDNDYGLIALLQEQTSEIFDDWHELLAIKLSDESNWLLNYVIPTIKNEMGEREAVRSNDKKMAREQSERYNALLKP